MAYSVLMSLFMRDTKECTFSRSVAREFYDYHIMLVNSIPRQLWYQKKYLGLLTISVKPINKPECDDFYSHHPSNKLASSHTYLQSRQWTFSKNGRTQICLKIIWLNANWELFSDNLSKQVNVFRRQENILL